MTSVQRLGYTNGLTVNVLASAIGWFRRPDYEQTSLHGMGMDRNFVYFRLKIAMNVSAPFGKVVEL